MYFAYELLPHTLDANLMFILHFLFYTIVVFGVVIQLLLLHEINRYYISSASWAKTTVSSRRLRRSIVGGRDKALDGSPGHTTAQKRANLLLCSAGSMYSTCFGSGDQKVFGSEELAHCL